MEEQEILNMEVGTKESEMKKLEPKNVKIVEVKIPFIEKAKSHKAVFTCKHPDSENTIDISAVAFLDGKQVKSVGTWIKVDEDNKLQKGTGTTRLLEKLGVTKLNDAKGKEAQTDTEDNGYLCFKAY